MKVIDLLNKIANGEIETNEKFCYKGEEYRHIDNLFGDYYVEDVLNNEVEVIEEDKKIEQLKNLNVNHCRDEVLYETLTKEQMALDIKTLQIWVNKIIDYINKENKNEN